MRAVGVALLVGLISVAGSSAATLRVPEDFSSVLIAVDSAALGDTVLVGPGTWTDTDTRVITYLGASATFTSTLFTSPGVTVIGAEGPMRTVLDAGPELGVSTVVHANNSTEPVRIEGFTITGGGRGASAASAAGVGFAGPLDLVNCRLVENERHALGSRLAVVSFTDCEITDNQIVGDGAVGGIDCSYEFTRCLIARNADHGIQLRNGGSAGLLRIVDCTIDDHTTSAVLAIDVSRVEVEGCSFSRNAPNGALRIANANSGFIRFSTFAFDSSAAGSGGGVFLTAAPLIVEDNTFYRCHGGISGGAIVIGGTDPGVANNVIVECTGPRGAVRRTVGPNHPNTGCNLFWNNESGNYFGEWTPSATDIEADPQFCAPEFGDYSLHASSPAASLNSPACGPIGAYGVGCGSVSIEATSWGRLKALYRDGSGGAQ